MQFLVLNYSFKKWQLVHNLKISTNNCSINVHLLNWAFRLQVKYVITRFIKDFLMREVHPYIKYTNHCWCCIFSTLPRDLFDIINIIDIIDGYISSTFLQY